MDEDEGVFCLWVHIYIVYGGMNDIEGFRPGLTLTNFDGLYFLCGAVLSWAPGSFVFPGKRELGNRGAEVEEDEGEGSQEHQVKGRKWGWISTGDPELPVRLRRMSRS